MGEGSGHGSGRVRLLVSNRGSGRVGSGQRFVGSGRRKVTRGQLCTAHDNYIALDISTRRFADLIDACEVSTLYLENCANVC